MLSNLQFLVLRCNCINNDIIKEFCNNLKSNEASQLKCLDLFDNQISKEGIDAISSILATNKQLEYLCLGKNKLEKANDIESLVYNIGKQFLSEQEVLDYREQEKRIAQILETNKKIKKKELQEHVPYLEPMQELEGKFFRMRNNKLSVLNLSMNSLGEDCKDYFEKLLKGVHDSFQLILNYNNFEEKTKDNLRKNYKKQLLI